MNFLIKHTMGQTNNTNKHGHSIYWKEKLFWGARHGKDKPAYRGMETNKTMAMNSVLYVCMGVCMLNNFQALALCEPDSGFNVTSQA